MPMKGATARSWLPALTHAALSMPTWEGSFSSCTVGVLPAQACNNDGARTCACNWPKPVLARQFGLFVCCVVAVMVGLRFVVVDVVSGVVGCCCVWLLLLLWSSVVTVIGKILASSCFCSVTFEGGWLPVGTPCGFPNVRLCVVVD